MGGRGIALLAAALTFVVARHAGLHRQTRCDVGLAFAVAVSLGLALTEMSGFPAFGLPVGIVSTASIWILVFLTMIPTDPLRAGMTAAASAAMVPLGIWITQQHGVDPVRPDVASILWQATALMAMVAFAVSRVLYRMGTAVSAAREMGSYSLDELLGKGGMGDVWKASHRLIKRPAAIKLIRADDLGPAGSGSRERAMMRFEREARATAGLSSKHTITLFDFGRADDGTFYYVMELLRGFDLETLVQRHGPVPAERTVHLLQQICHSLIEAHECGMVHRDIKPANIFSCHLGPDFDYVKVLDFGLVKESAGADDTDIKLTVEGSISGTPAYMPPETALGKQEPDPRGDIYMVGCVGYWLLTGQLVFDGNSPLAIVSQHIHEEAPAPSTRTELHVPAALEAVIMDCLKKNPDERPQTARELRSRLQSCALDEVWSPERAERWWRTHHPEI